VEGFKEVPGQGVSGFVYGRFYELKRGENAGTAISCALYEDEKFVMGFHFEARLKADCAEVLATLRWRGYRVVLLSGDERQAVQPMAKFLGFAPGDVHFELSPADKARLVSEAPQSMMIGDGINDSLALMRAHVGVAVAGGVETALKSAAIYVGNPGLSGIIDLIDTSFQARSSIRQNLVLSAIYNAAGAALALAGLVNPLVAALLMPLSSGVILFSTWLRGRR
jgi:Cu2+-exporting ATPase/Cu+-exporting ATPase